ncbi:MAG TPA: hypothetical protein VLM40_20135, partial [Gemmata sp.]|nr:hypothetical protein [Gemmata sp.]
GSGDAKGSSLFTQEVQQRGLDEIRRRGEELERQVKESEREINRVSRQCCIEILIMNQDFLITTRKRIKSLDIVGPPTERDASLMKAALKQQRRVEEEIKGYNANLRKLDPPSELESW